ncbi:thioredoxin family protein [Rhizobium sp. 2MFCol3.1]|uniref:thioredoxin family protein n=1 Tax=Rhizobium sp. 2MFCol3.1 TaxID=1246459 RepID=UPI000377505C|nr:thioredoxin family protein [Rhizobium sp. 2MFCol3.1]
MPKTVSNSIELGTKAADFILSDAKGAPHKLSDFDAATAVLVAFISNRCPFVQLIRDEFASFAREYQAKGLQVIAINSNDADAHPEESIDAIGREVEAIGYSFPYLKDENQAVAKAYGAACTPDLFLFDGSRKLVYHGQFDASRPGNGKVATGEDLRAAVNAVLAGGKPATEQTPSIGCNIKWTAGNEPSWFSNAA